MKHSPKPTDVEILAALATMRLSIAFVPAEPAATAIIVLSLGNMVGTKVELDWLTYIACNVMSKWSLAELRGLFCTRYTPRDGVYVECTLPGHTPMEVARRNEAIPLDGPTTRLLSPAPEIPPTAEELAEYADLERKIRAAGEARKIQPGARIVPRVARLTAAEMREAEAELARAMSKRVLDHNALEKAVRALEQELGITPAQDTQVN